MSTKKLWRQAHVLWQEPDANGCSLPEPAIAVHVDSGGTLCLEQEDNTITVNWASVAELIGLLKDAAKQRPIFTRAGRAGAKPGTPDADQS